MEWNKIENKKLRGGGRKKMTRYKRNRLTVSGLLQHLIQLCGTRVGRMLQTRRSDGTRQRSTVNIQLLELMGPIHGRFMGSRWVEMIIQLIWSLTKPDYRAPSQLTRRILLGWTLKWRKLGRSPLGNSPPVSMTDELAERGANEV